MQLLLLAASASAQLQEMPQGELRIGLIGGSNWNYVDANAPEYIEASEGSTLPTYFFAKTTSYAPFAGFQLDYDFSELVGFHAHLAYDDRRVSGHSGEADLTARLSYLTLEPAIRITNPGRTRIFMLAGPSLFFNLGHSYDFLPPDGAGGSVRDAEIEYVNKLAFGLWVGFGIDLPLSVDPHGVGWYLTPFFDGSYLFNQINYTEDRSAVQVDEEYHQWYTVTFRGGIGIKYSFGKW
jgi:hypothetical protein